MPGFLGDSHLPSFNKIGFVERCLSALMTVMQVPFPGKHSPLVELGRLTV